MRRWCSERRLVALALLLPAACTGGMGAPPPPPGSGGSASIVGADLGLVSAVAGDGVVRLDWKATDLDGSAVAVALFQAPDPDLLFAGAPVAVGVGGGSTTLAGLTNGAKLYFGLALDLGGGQHRPVGAALWARPNAPIYVLAGADPGVADGLSPATAFPDPISGILTALSLGGGNVWVGAGDYLDLALPLYSRVDLYGGFAPDFALATRDPGSFPSRLHGRNPLNLLTLADGDTGSVLDGLELLGDDAGVIGFEAQDTPCQLRSLVVRRQKGRGLKIVSTVESLVLDASVVNCVVESNGADGLFVQGAVHLTIERSRFAANGQEGAECSALVAPDGERIVVGVRRSQFADNGFEGLKLNLAAPSFPTFPASFDVAIEGSSFERNRQKAGLLLDIDFNLVAGWSLDLVLRGCVARNNQNDGVQLQLDSTSTTLIQGLVANANGGDGLQVSSQSTPSHAVVVGSVFAANRGFGLLAENGNVPVLVSHSIFAGNGLGGAVSPDVSSSVVSSIGALQPGAFAGLVTHHVALEPDPDAPLFVRAPREYRAVEALSGAKLALDSLGDLASGDRVEFADDGVARSVASLGPGTLVALEPPVDSPLVPTALLRFAGGSDVAEDLHVVAGSVAAGAAMVPVGAPALDAGVYGAPGAAAPGRFSALAGSRFFLARVTPRLDQPLGGSSTLELEFLGGTLDPSSADASRVRALDALGNPLAIALLSVGDELHVAPPAGGWPQGQVRLEVHAGLRSLAGDELAAPVLLAYDVP